MKNWRLAVALLLCLTLVSSMACNPFGDDSQEETNQQLVEVVRDDLIVSVSGSGSTEISNEVRVVFGTSGMIDKIFADEGDEVTEGEMLAELDATPLELALIQAQAILAQAQTDLIQAQIDQAPAQATLAQAQAALTQEQVTRTQAQIELNLAGTVGEIGEGDLSVPPHGAESTSESHHRWVLFEVLGTEPFVERPPANAQSANAKPLKNTALLG